MAGTIQRLYREMQYIESVPMHAYGEVSIHEINSKWSIHVINSKVSIYDINSKWYVYVINNIANSVSTIYI